MIYIYINIFVYNIYLYCLYDEKNLFLYCIYIYVFLPCNSVSSRGWLEGAKAIVALFLEVI